MVWYGMVPTHVYSSCALCWHRKVPTHVYILLLCSALGRMDLAMHAPIEECRTRACGGTCPLTASVHACNVVHASVSTCLSCVCSEQFDEVLPN